MNLENENSFSSASSIKKCAFIIDAKILACNAKHMYLKRNIANIFKLYEFPPAITKL